MFNERGWSVLGERQHSNLGERRRDRLSVSCTGTALWTSLASEFENVSATEERAMLAVYANRRTGERAPNTLAKGTFIEQDHASAGARLIVGSANSHFSAEALWVRYDRVDGLNDRFWNVSALLEQRVVDNIWLSVTIGRQAGRDEGYDASSLVSAFKWVWAPESRPPRRRGYRGQQGEPWGLPAFSTFA